MRASSELFIPAESVLAPYRGLTEFHVPHGHRHISEFSHLMLGKAAAEKIAELRSRPLPGHASPLASAKAGATEEAE